MLHDVQVGSARLLASLQPTGDGLCRRDASWPLSMHDFRGAFKGWKWLLGHFVVKGWYSRFDRGVKWRLSFTRSILEYIRNSWNRRNISSSNVSILKFWLLLCHWVIISKAGACNLSTRNPVSFLCAWPHNALNFQLRILVSKIDGGSHVMCCNCCPNPWLHIQPFVLISFCW